MTDASNANWEVAVVLPLGVVANQLLRIEEQLRRLNMKALSLARAPGRDRPGTLIDARLDEVLDSLDSIRGLVGDIQRDLSPTDTAGTHPAVPAAGRAEADQEPRSGEWRPSVRTPRLRRDDRDD